jgi:multiple sugar transport system substrate-binding protein
MKKQKKMKWALGAGVALLSLVSLGSCGSSAETITVWTFTNELKTMINDYYIPAKKPNTTINVVSIELNSMANRLVSALSTGKGLPDMVALEASVVLNFTENQSSKFEPLNSIVDSGATSAMYSYTKDIVTTSDGNVMGLAWQATPGGFFYRSDLAAKLGFSTPEAMQSEIATWSGFLDLASKCKDQGLKVVSGITEPIKVYLAQREKGWLDGNKLYIDPKLYSDPADSNALQMMYELQQKGYTNESTERDARWTDDIQNGSVLGYFASSWGLYFDLKANCGDTDGKWALAKGPGSYYNGGTWLSCLSAASASKKAIIKDMIQYFTTDETFLSNWCKKTGDFMNNSTIMASLKDNYSEPFLGGQNHLKILYDVASSINGSLISKYDSKINGMFKDAGAQYALQEKAKYTTIDGTIEQFKSLVRSTYKDIEVD